jgi:CBF1 interacting corepressor
MAGMKFLNLKGWHPSNARNQKRIWIAEQKAEQKAQAERDAAAEVRKHAETHSFQVLAAAKGDAESARRSEQMQVGFLYAPPPGLEKVDEKVAHEMTEGAFVERFNAQDSGLTSRWFLDDAVREFRRKMEKRSATAASGDDVRRPLERYVGRRPDEMLTIKEQVERFPFLKDAPVEGDYASNVKVNFKPMGRTLRNVKCMRCGEWGHQSGDRECALRDANPLDAARQAREDPMAMVAKLKKEGQLVLKQRALPLEMQQGTAAGKGQEYEILLSDGTWRMGSTTGCVGVGVC